MKRWHPGLPDMMPANRSPIIGWTRRGAPVFAIAGGAGSGTYGDEQLTMDFTTTLAAAITTTTALSLTVASVSAFVATAGHWRIRVTDGVNEEWIHATSRSGTTFSWPDATYRGSENNDGTKIARTWLNGATVEFVLTEAALKNAFTGTPGPYSRRDYEIYGSGSSYVLVDNRANAIKNTYTNGGAATNAAMTFAMLKGPVGSQNLGTPGASISLVNTDATNTAWTIPSTDYIGKATNAGTLGQVTSGAPGFVDTTANFTSADVGRLFYLCDNAGANSQVTTIQSVTNTTTIVMKDNAGFTSSTNAKWSEPITIGMKLHGQGGGTRAQGNGHPDDGGLYLQATGGTWTNKALVDFRNAPTWQFQGFGSEFFELRDVTMDANSLSDYALVGMGVGTGNAARCHSYTAQGGAVANVGIGNHWDHAASSDVFHTDFVLGKPAGTTSKTWQGGAGTLPATPITLNNTTGISTEGFCEITSTQGTQLVYYTNVSGATLTGAIGGKGTMANGNAVKFIPYGFEVNEGDVYVIDDFNIATNDHSFLVNQNSSSLGTCLLGQGHHGGGSGGPDIVIAWGKRVTIKGYQDNEKGDRGGVWICPMANNAVSHVVVEPLNFFNVQDANAVPICFDGANIGGSAANAGFGYQVSGITNGHQTTGVTDCAAFAKFVNGWPSNTGIAFDSIKATNVNALYANDAFTTWAPGASDTIGVNIQLSNSNTSGGAILVPVKFATANTASQPTAAFGGNGAFSYDSSKNRLMQSSGTELRPMISTWWTASSQSGTGGTLTCNMSNGDAFERTVTGTTAGSTVTVNAPTQALQGEELTIVIFNNTTSTGTVAVTFNAVFLFNFGAWTNPAQGKRKMVRFKLRADGTTWDAICAPSNDY